MYRDYGFEEYNDLILKQLPKGAFLTTKVENKVNTMTIGWGDLSIVWNRKIFMVYVRYSRETYNMIEIANEFTVSFPINVDMKNELKFAGTHSFRDYDKIRELELKLEPGLIIDTPVIKKCDLHLECKVIYRQALDPTLIPEEIKQKYYDINNDFHVIYYGEIVAKYGNV